MLALLSHNKEVEVLLCARRGKWLFVGGISPIVPFEKPPAQASGADGSDRPHGSRKRCEREPYGGGA